MGLSRRRAAWLRVVFAVLLVAAFLSSSVGMALASTNGVLSGTVKDEAGHPLADVRVTAASPSGSYNATTNGSGFYSMTGVYADTYTVSFQLASYQSASVPGVTVFADQVATVNETMVKSFKTIATVRSHSIASAYQPNQTTDTVTVGAPQIQQFQGSTFNSSETNLLTSLPGATADSSGYPVIHGGREYEEGFEFEGIPYTDAYSNQFNNSLSIPTAGVSLVQLTPGAGDITQSAGGGFGAFNVVSKRGTYPAYATIGAAVGGPGFDHRLNFDHSWATPDGRWSNYMSFANSNETFQFGREQYPYAQIGRFYSDRMETDREFLDNLVFRFGHNNSQSLQAFVDLADHHFYEGAGGFGDASNSLCFASCDPNYRNIWSSYLSPGFWFGPPFGFLSPNQVTAISTLYPGQSSQYETLASASNRAPFTYFQPNQAFKLAYTNNFNSSTFLNLTAYRTNSVTRFDGPAEEGGYASDIYIMQGGQTSGVTLSLQKQLSDKHLLEVGADVSHLHPVDSYMSDSFAFAGAIFTGLLGGAYDELFLPEAFLPNDANCPLPAGVAQPCGYAQTAGQPTQYYPQFDQIASVNRQDYSLYVSDKWTPNDRLNLSAGVRMDAATYRMPTPGIDPTTCTTQYYPTTWTAPTTFDAADGWKCNASATFSFPADAVKPKVFQPRLGISYKLGADTSLRLTYSRAVQFVPIASIDYGEVDAGKYEHTPYGNLAPYDPAGVGTNCGLTGFFVNCRTFGEQLYWSNQNYDGIPYQPARPTTSDNWQFTFSHQFTHGVLDGVALSISPWMRKQHDTIANESSPILGSNGQPEVVNGSLVFGPPILTNNGKEQATGIDFNLTRNVAYGLSAQLTASYINEFSSVIPLSGSEDFYPSIVPASVALGNMYRVGFLSPFQSTLALSYHTRSGWRITPRYTYNIGYPTGLGMLTAAFVNNTAYNLPNTNAIVGSAPAGPACFVDPVNPGSLFAPNLAACRGEAETSSPGGKLTPAQGYLDLTLEYAPPSSKLTYGVNVSNVFNEYHSGPLFNSRYQPLATGVSGPLTGYSTSSVNYTNYPSAWPKYASYLNPYGVYVNEPSGIGRTIYFYVQARL
jgi:hypothetical protein